MRDFLREVWEGVVDPESAWEEFSVLLRSGLHPEKDLYLTRTEWTAWLLGVDPGELANWRYRGWPRICPRCREIVVLEDALWSVVECADDEGHKIVHTWCRPETQDQVERKDEIEEEAGCDPQPARSHCCEMMTEQLALRCLQHPNPYDCPDVLVTYSDCFDEYGIIVHDGAQSCVGIAYCPWCGIRLPESKRDRWFAELEAKGFDDPLLQDIPPEYKSDAWWRKR